MATKAEAKSTADHLRKSLDALILMEPNYVREDLGGFSFKGVEHEIQVMMKACTDLRAADLDSISVAQLAQLQQRAQQIQTHLNPLLAFDPLQDGQNPKERHRQMSNQVSVSMNDATKDMAAAASYYGRGEIVQLESTARELVQKTQASIDTSLKNIAEAQKTADQMLQALKDASGQASVSLHTDVFKSQAEEHLIAAHRWQVFFISSAIGGLFLIWLFFIGPLKPELIAGALIAEAIYNVTSRLLFFSIVSSVIYWSARNFLSHRHNYVVNKHRQNALATFQTFINAPVERQIKDTVLLQAAQTIFSAQQTGYVENERMPQLVSGAEVIKTIISSNE